MIDPEQISHFKKIFWYKGDGGGAEPVENYQPTTCGSIEGYTGQRDSLETPYGYGYVNENS